ncbi:Ig-like domain-containing protein, partial [Pantoea ananatis]|uniref:Ig-like domain-containing protein n=1 Tax=Pantoea ananas TaxID=553 RepID=UPI003C19FC41
VILTSSTLAVADITVSAAVGSTAAVRADRTVSFVADAATAKVSAVVLNGTAVSKVADGKNTFTYTVTVTDGNGNPVAGATVTPEADKAGVTVKAGGATGADGQATVTLTSSTLAVADITVSAAVGSTAAVRADRTVSFVAGVPDGYKSGLSLTPPDISADGRDASIVTLLPEDKNGNAVTGMADKLSISVTDINGKTISTGIIVSSLIESGTPGTYTAKVTGTAAGTYIVKPLYDKTAIGSLQLILTLKAAEGETSN